VEERTRRRWKIHTVAKVHADTLLRIIWLLRHTRVIETSGGPRRLGWRQQYMNVHLVRTCLLVLCVCVALLNKVCRLAVINKHLD